MQEYWQHPANRAKFKERNLHTLGPDMPAAIENYVEEMHTQTTVDKFSSQGHYKDKQDLQEKYKNKPEQLASILQNAPQMECKIRSVTFYKDPDYTDTHEKTEEDRRQVKKALSQQQDNFVKKACA